MRTARYAVVWSGLIAVAWGLFPRASEAGIIVPSDLNPGDKFRYVFVTTPSTDATSSDINYYDAFVNTAADASSLTGVPDLAWRVIGSTSTVAAKDHLVDVSGGWSPDSVPIYLLDSTTRIASSFEDLWDGSLNAPISLNENGLATFHPIVWTGTRGDGTISSISPLGGSTLTMRGMTDHQATFRWIQETSFNNKTAINGHLVALAVYAISDVIEMPQESLEAVPEPSSLALLGIGGVGMIVGAARRRARYAKT